MRNRDGGPQDPPPLAWNPPGSLSLAKFTSHALCPLPSGLYSMAVWNGLMGAPLRGKPWGKHQGPPGEAWLTLNLRLVHDEVAGGPAALKLLRAALLGTELFILSLVEGKPRGGEPAVAGSARKGCQWVLLGMEGQTERKKVAESQNAQLCWHSRVAFGPSRLCRSPRPEDPQISLANPTFMILPCLCTSYTIIFLVLLRYN